MKNPKALEIAAAIGQLLEREKVHDVGIAIGIVLGQFSLLPGLDDGAIDAIAEDAKTAAAQLKRMRQ